MDDDGLEVIDLTRESDHDGKTPRTTDRPRGRRVMILAAGIGVLAAVGGLLAHHKSGRPAATVASTTSSLSTQPVLIPATSWVPPSGLRGLASDRFVAVIDGIPVLEGVGGRARHLLDDIDGSALLGISLRGEVLVVYPHLGTRVIDGDLGPVSSGIRNVLPSPIALLPDAAGRWWSNFGQLESPNQLHEIRFPVGTTPVAKLRDGYLLVDDAHTALLEWRPGARFVRVGVGSARILAIADDRVAWADDVGSFVHVAELTTGRTINIDVRDFATTARFSPDRSRLAVLTSAETASMVLADPISGRVITRLATSDAGLDALDTVPPAFDPVPFSWDRTGRLLLVTPPKAGNTFVKTLDPARGAVTRTIAAPDDLQQVVVLTP